MFSVGGGRVAEVFIAEAQGYFDLNLTPESVAANWDKIANFEGYTVPSSSSEETALYLRT